MLFATTLCAAIFFAACVWSQPAPAILYKVHPDPPNLPQILSTCPPTVVSATSAFICYHYFQNATDVVQYVNPTDPSDVGVQATMSSSPFVFAPIAVGPFTAIAFSTSSQSSVYTEFSKSQVLKTVDRHGSGAQVPYAPDLKMSFVSFGIASRLGLSESIEGLRVNVTQQADAVAWSNPYTIPPNWPRSSDISTPLYYAGTLLYVKGVTVYKVDAKTGFVIDAWTNPCSLAVAPNETLYLWVTTYAYEANGSPLDAFLISANTSNATAAQHTICRFSHNSGTPYWATTLKNDMRLYDVTSATQVAFFTAELLDVIAPNGLMKTFTLDMSTGATSAASIMRSIAVDGFSFPAILPKSLPACAQTMILQVSGSVSAYCVEDLSKQQWSQRYGCDDRPVVYAPTNSIVCYTSGLSVQMIDGNGTIVWRSKGISAWYQPTIVNDVVYVIDIDSTLWGLNVSALAPVEKGSGDSLTSGEIVLILFVFIFIAALVGAIAASWLKRAKRRKAYAATAADEMNYGSLST